MDISKFQTMDMADVAGKRVMVRVDYNLPMRDGQITDDTRLTGTISTVEDLVARKAKVILLAHLGRPKGEVKPEMSLEPVAEYLASKVDTKVHFANDCIGAPVADAVELMQDGEILLCENARFHKGEEKNDPAFCASLAENCDIYVNDAFSVSHRAHGTTEGLAKLRPAFAGHAMHREVNYLTTALSNPERPMMAVVGGAKVSTKLDVLTNLVEKADFLVVGGGMANTFLLAMGMPIGKSLAEADLVDTAKSIMAKAAEHNCEIVLPSDVVVAKTFDPSAERIEPTEVKSANDVADDDLILDLGPDSVNDIAAKMDGCKTLIWNGPLGAFEVKPFDVATIEAAKFAAKKAVASEMVAVAGGGDTVAAMNVAGVTQDMTFVSLAGGAFLEWMEGKELPGVVALFD